MTAVERNNLRELTRRNSLALDEFLGRIALREIDPARRRDFANLIQIAGSEEARSRNRDPQNERSRRRGRASRRHLFDLQSPTGRKFPYKSGRRRRAGVLHRADFQVYVPDWGVEIGSGGRYDNLADLNRRNPEPAIGFSFSLDGLPGVPTVKQGIEKLFQR
ncbi:MAG: ATP phosphoribosyltransferase regulatory subunit [Acidobacteria bacterium]|nr:ATP phosphoribosyltransferase regulatory subunit [Acidobacteriota bacterium]